jgi:hypothetical protein
MMCAQPRRAAPAQPSLDSRDSLPSTLTAAPCSIESARRHLTPVIRALSIFRRPSHARPQLAVDGRHIHAGCGLLLHALPPQLVGTALRMVRRRRHARRCARASWRPLRCGVGARWAVSPSEGLGAVRGGSMRHVHAAESASMRCSRYPICEAIEDRRARYYGLGPRRRRRQQSCAAHTWVTALALHASRCRGCRVARHVTPQRSLLSPITSHHDATSARILYARLHAPWNRIAWGCQDPTTCHARARSSQPAAADQRPRPPRFRPSMVRQTDVAPPRRRPQRAERQA